MGIMFLAGAVVLGTGIVRLVQPLRSLLNHVEQVMWGLVIGWVVSTLGAYWLARMAGSLSFRPLVFFAIGLWIAAVFLWLPRLREVPRVKLKTIWRAEYRGLAIVLALFMPIYIRLFASHMMQPGAGGIYSAGSTLYDLSFHLALTTSFLFGQNFPPVYTPFPPAPLLYPFLPDFQIAVLATLGMNLRTALLATSVPLALAITGLLYSFAKRILTPTGNLSTTASTIPNTQLASLLATILFLFNGGLGFIYFYGDWRRSGESLAAFWSQLDVNYANIGERNTQWTNFICDTLLPQRSSLFGYAVALMVFTLFAIAWNRFYVEEDANVRWDGWHFLVVAGVLTGLLPFFHAHCFLGIGLISGFLFLLHPRRQWIAFWIPAILFAAPYLISVTSHISASSFMRFQPGWRGHGEPSWIWYWLRNIGLPTLLIFPAWFAAPPVWRKFYLAFLLLLVFSLLVVVSPNNYDNIKLLFLWYVPTTVLVAAWLVQLAYVHRQKLLASVLTLFCVASGVLALQHENVNRSLLFTDEEMAAAMFARVRTQPQALFLTAPTVLQPILSLAGRPVLRGDTAWLWSHGYEFADREADVKSIYAGTAQARSLISYYGVEYIYFGPGERQAGANESFLETFPKIYQSPNIAIYDVSGGRSEKTEPPAKVAPREFAALLTTDPYQLLVEFPRASYPVYRFYKAGFNRWPRYDEFMSDMKVVGRGVYVGTPGWQQILEANKQSLLEAWQEKVEFKALYDSKTNAEFVDAIFRNLATKPDSAERAALITALEKRSRSRAFVLKRIAENATPANTDYNTAYVLAHYFGYLHRDPDDLPDRDLTGFNYWLNDLNDTRDYRSLTRVFIESDEYKERKP